MRRRVTLCVLACLFFVGLSTLGFAAEASSNKTSSQKYDLSFTLPTAGISGCTVCHSDAGILRKDAGGHRSVYVDQTELADGPHKNLACTSCHTDFASKKGHDAVANSDTWRDVAKLSCKSCHKEQYTGMMRGVHTTATQSGIVGASSSGTPTLDELAVAKQRSKTSDLQGNPLSGKKTPLCGDCHDAHAIRSFKSDPEYRAQFRADSIKLCGSSECHPNEADSYNDPYHGKAAHRGSKTAPTCWDCHGTHEIMKSTTLYSKTYSGNLPETCSACHVDAGGEYISYAKAIHGYDEVLADNVGFVKVRSAVLRVTDAIVSFIKSLRFESKGPAQ